MERDLNLTSNLVRATSFGLLDPDDNIWTGLVGMVQRGEAEVSLSAMSTTYSRFLLIFKRVFLYKNKGNFFRSLAVDYLNAVTEVNYVLATYKRRELAGEPLNVFTWVLCYCNLFFWV